MPNGNTPAPGTKWLSRPDGTQMLHIFEESAVPPYQLPDPLRFEDGRAVQSPQDWPTRRQELLRLFASQVYGCNPTLPYQLEFQTQEGWTVALEGLALRKQVAIHILTERGHLAMNLLLYRPAVAPQPVPVFIGLNFDGNHSIHADPAIRLPAAWPLKTPVPGRGTRSRRWPLELILKAGFALATVCYHELDPDFDDAFQNGLQPLFYQPGQTQPAADEWGSIGVWAFGMSRILDYLETESSIHAQKAAVIGHSRLGKTALWAGAQDERFALVVSNESGCGGAALSRRVFGEHLKAINYTFPHWFCANFKHYSDNEPALPVDQHQLLALIAPRPLYVASAAEDLWSDPRGEFLGARAASTVYAWLGGQGLPMTEFPGLDATDFSGQIAYHIRSGVHELTQWDWEQYLQFAKLRL